MTAEEWRTVDIATDYQVSSLGRVRSLKLGTVRVLRPGIHERGYHHYSLCIGNRTLTRSAHVMVLSAFVGPRPEGMQIRHLDGDPANNALANLAYGTAEQNMADKREHGRNHNLNKTYCPHGHPYNELNTYFTPQGFRQCRTCTKARAEARKARVAA